MKKILILLLTFSFAIGATAQDSKTVAKKAKSEKVAILSQDPSIFIESDVVDYGTIKKGADPIRKFQVMNKGAKPLLLTNCTGSCGCTVPTCPREPIMPGKSAEITIKYDTNRVGPISKSVTIMSNDPQHKAKVVRVKGLVEQASK